MEPDTWLEERVDLEEMWIPYHERAVFVPKGGRFFGEEW